MTTTCIARRATSSRRALGPVRPNVFARGDRVKNVRKGHNEVRVLIARGNTSVELAYQIRPETVAHPGEP
jgi:hypothetical protein